jgi:hypothetical protein
MKGIIALAALLAGCYTGAPANRDVQASWRGRSRAEIVDRWGGPAHHEDQPPNAIDVWSFTRVHFTLPEADVSVQARPVTAVAQVQTPGGPGEVAVQATAYEVHHTFRPGEVWKTVTEAAAIVDPSGTIQGVEGAALHWGPPNDVNLHWGVVLGAHVGMGRLDTTSTWLPSGGAYIGGMLNPQTALVGTFGLGAGSSDMGSAMSFGWGLAGQWWPENRIWVRAGPAALLVMDPGFTNTRFRAGVTAGASYAFVKAGNFALDARFDIYAAQDAGFGTVGVGVNLN